MAYTCDLCILEIFPCDYKASVLWLKCGPFCRYFFIGVGASIFWGGAKHILGGSFPCDAVGLRFGTLDLWGTHGPLTLVFFASVFVVIIIDAEKFFISASLN